MLNKVLHIVAIISRLASSDQWAKMIVQLNITLSCSHVWHHQVGEADRIYLLMKEEYRISRNVRLAWFLGKLNQVIWPASKPELVNLLSLLPLLSSWWPSSTNIAKFISCLKCYMQILVCFVIMYRFLLAYPTADYGMLLLCRYSSTLHCHSHMWILWPSVWPCCSTAIWHIQMVCHLCSGDINHFLITQNLILTYCT